jgi:hypothetical protein
MDELTAVSAPAPNAEEWMRRLAGHGFNVNEADEESFRLALDMAQIRFATAPCDEKTGQAEARNETIAVSRRVG